jgi:hypothetical protein
MKNFLTGYPSIDKLQKEMQGVSSPDIREANGHILSALSQIWIQFSEWQSKRKLLFWGSMIFM